MATVLKTPTTFLTTAGGVKPIYLTSSSSSSSSIKLPSVRRRLHPTTYNNNNPTKFPTRSLASFSAQHTVEENVDSDNCVSNDAASVVLGSLSVYKEALANNDYAKIAEVESLLKSIENEKIELGHKLEMILEELSNQKAGILTISSEFNNFRKKTEMERMSLVSDAREQVLESLLPVVDEFERIIAQMKVEKEGEEKISNSYVSIYKQFVEILGSLRDEPDETIGDEPSDPMVSSQAGTRFSRTIYQLRQKLNRVYSEFTKTWIRF